MEENMFHTNERGTLAKCKVCGNSSPAKDFKIHDELKIMVCSTCFSKPKLMKYTVLKEKIESKEENPKPLVIYDDEDVFREFSNQEIREKRKEHEKDPRVKKICDRCSFNFKYNPKKDFPNKCPSCGKLSKDIGRGYSLLY